MMKREREREREREKLGMGESEKKKLNKNWSSLIFYWIKFIWTANNALLTMRTTIAIPYMHTP